MQTFFWCADLVCGWPQSVWNMSLAPKNLPIWRWKIPPWAPDLQVYTSIHKYVYTSIHKYTQVYTSIHKYTQARLFKDDLWILISCWQRIRENQRGTIPAKPTLNNLCHRMRSCLSSLVSFSIFVCNYILRLGFGGCSSESINWAFAGFPRRKNPAANVSLKFLLFVRLTFFSG